ncbi:hypothetical protein EDC04DRAFT_2641371 [Pisolithus marmoratus]|nr:hypothetical protein EDC04DRAFT_2641371 [Pisolithus marmoratus]
MNSVLAVPLVRGTVHGRVRNDVPGRTPAPTHRHAAPSGPWPWMDFDVDPHTTSSGSIEVDKTWRGYPQNLFANWTPEQVERSKMLTSCPPGACKIYRVDVLKNGTFDRDIASQTLTVAAHGLDECWEYINAKRPESVRLRAIFVDTMTVDLLKMLGTKYVIEPFFFSSSMNWIPSRYQEAEKDEGDHITIVLPFVRAKQSSKTRPSSVLSSSTFPATVGPAPLEDSNQIIDTQASLPLISPDCVLVQDLLAVHMVRHVESSTIITYHPHQRTSAKRLHSLIQRTSNSVYWSKIFEASSDPTLLLLTYLWYVLYAWDETFEELYKHITRLETRVLSTHDIKLTQQLHIVQAHLLHYESLLQAFQKSVEFVRDTRNPAMSALSEQERNESLQVLQREAKNLLSEISRLEVQRLIQSARLKNVMDLAFASVNIDDSRYTKRLTEATVRDSAAMKQISYLTMVFLPANFTASLFGMNVREFIGSPGGTPAPETLPRYVAVTLALTSFTVWLVIALQTYSSFHPPNSSRWRRFGWPIFYVRDKLRCRKAPEK